MARWAVMVRPPLGFLAIMWFFFWVIASQPLAWWSRINGSGTDFLRHLGLIRDVRDVGRLVPGEAGYPKALHAAGHLAHHRNAAPTDAEALWLAIAPLGRSDARL